jgi:group I intron endonuclease
MGWIYIATSPSGKSYIGQTKQSHPWKRWTQHCSEAKTGKTSNAFHNAIRKYGSWDAVNKTIRNFEMDYYECPDEDLNHDEHIMITMMETFHPNGYNLISVVDSVYQISDITRKRMSDNNARPFLGRHHTDEHKQYMSDIISKANQGRYASEKNPCYGLFGGAHPRSKKTYQFTIDGRFVRSWDSVKDAADELGLNASNISTNISGRSKHCGHFLWSFTPPPL